MNRGTPSTHELHDEVRARMYNRPSNPFAAKLNVILEGLELLRDG